jgi:FKBP-type peptidyl-prolyl cis-trans isomerase
MKQFLLSIFIISPILLFSFPKKKWKKTQDGIYYKIFSKDTISTKPEYDDYIWMHLRKYSVKNKEVFNTHVFDKENGVELQIKRSEKKGEITQFFTLMCKGDSAVVKIPANWIDSNGSSKKYYTFILNLIRFKRFQTYQYEKNQQYARQVILDSLSITDYINNNNLKNFNKDAEGIWFNRSEIGDGKKIENDDKIKLHYIGKLLNGVEFDNSFSRKMALEFTVNKHQVIDGLEKGILHFFNGDKGTIIMPSRLAYGDKEVGKIPPNSVLIFDIKIQ